MTVYKLQIFSKLQILSSFLFFFFIRELYETPHQK